jgi:hypothetical protein
MLLLFLRLIIGCSYGWIQFSTNDGSVGIHFFSPVLF